MLFPLFPLPHMLCVAQSLPLLLVLTLTHLLSLVLFLPLLCYPYFSPSFFLSGILFLSRSFVCLSTLPFPPSVSLFTLLASALAHTLFSSTFPLTFPFCLTFFASHRSFYVHCPSLTCFASLVYFTFPCPSLSLLSLSSPFFYVFPSLSGFPSLAHFSSFLHSLFLLLIHACSLWLRLSLPLSLAISLFIAC